MINIAVDGPAGAGKSSISKVVAKKLGYIYVDTGALYRAIGLYVFNNGLDTNNEHQVNSVLDKIDIKLKFVNNEQIVELNGIDVSKDIRSTEISSAASNVSKFKEVRSFLMDLQKNIAKNNNILMDGRDIGTVILPNADVKIFLTASIEVRAKRRYLQDIESGKQVEYKTILDEFTERDYNDSHRAIAPLKPANDAILLDTSDMEFDEVVNKMLEIIRLKVKI